MLWSLPDSWPESERGTGILQEFNLFYSPYVLDICYLGSVNVASCAFKSIIQGLKVTGLFTVVEIATVK